MTKAYLQSTLNMVMVNEYGYVFACMHTHSVTHTTSYKAHTPATRVNNDNDDIYYPNISVSIYNSNTHAEG